MRCEASESILSKLREQLDNAALDEQSHSYMHFAAGKVCDDAGDFERAFSVISKGINWQGTPLIAPGTSPYLRTLSTSTDLH